MMTNSNRTGWNNLSNDLLYHIINLIPSTQTLKSLSCVERRCHPPCSARLNKTMSTILHAAARIGDTHRISSLFYRWHIPVMLQDENGGTILKTALESRQLDTVQWLMQPLSQWREYLPISSGIFAPSWRTEDVKVKPRLLPEDYCRRMMALDGIPALRSAAADGDIDLLDRLLPMLPSYSYKYKNDEISREFMMEMRDALIQFAAMNQNNNGDDSLLKTFLAAIIIDRRLRYADIENTFGSFEEEKIEALFAQDQAQPQRQVKELFGWRFSHIDQRTVLEGQFFNASLRGLARLGRIDLVDWLFNRWGVFYNSFHGETLADTVVISPWGWYDIDKMFEEPNDSESQKRENDLHYFPSVLKMWRNRQPLPKHWISETSQEDKNQLYTYQSSPLPCDTATLFILLKAAVAYLSKEENSIHFWKDLEITKKTLTFVEPATDLTPMLDYLSNNNHGRPSLALLACRGAPWAFDWLLQQNDFTLEMTTDTVPEDLRFRLHNTVPWLTPNLEKRLPIASVLAAVCASYGAVAMLEKISHINAKYLRMRFYRGRTLLHLTARNRQRVTTIWLMENGYHDLLRCRSRGRPLEMRPYRHSKTLCSRRCSSATPLLDAVAGGDPEIIRYLLERDGAVGEPIVGVSGGSLWEEIALESKCDAVRDVAIVTRMERILDVMVPSLLRDGTSIADIQTLMMLEGVCDGLYGELRYIRKLLQAAMIGKREDFLRFMYESNGGAPPYITQGITGYAGYDTKYNTHFDICREIFGASGKSMSCINLVIDEMKSKSESAHDCSMELHKLSQQLESLVTAGSTVDIIVEVVTKIGVLLQDDSQTNVDCDKMITVYGMTLKPNRFHNGEHDLKFKVKSIGSFELFTSCAMYGHLHLLSWLLEGKQPPNLMQIGNALVDCLKWGGQTRSVEFLVQYLEEKGVDLNTIQRTNQKHPSNQIGVLEYAMEGIVISHRYFERRQNDTSDNDNDDWINSSWDNARWLAKHTKAQLRTNSFPDLVSNYEISILLDCENKENQCFVLKLTRFCVETLNASWSDVTIEKDSEGRREEGRTAIQLLLNGGWIEAVSWLAKEHGASLQGLIVERTSYLSYEKKEKYCKQLQQLQEEQQAAWLSVGVL